MQYMALPTTDTDIPFTIFKTEVKSLQNKNIIQSIQQSSKFAFKHLMNKTNPAIISLSLNCPLYNNIINMDIIKLNNIERKLDIKT